MKNDNISINTSFIKKIAPAALAQFIILGIIFIFYLFFSNHKLIHIFITDTVLWLPAILLAILITWLAKSSRLQEEKIFREARRTIANQVAHDIRSPLAAINTLLLDSSEINEKKRALLRNAAIKLNDIVENLLVSSNSYE